MQVIPTLLALTVVLRMCAGIASLNATVDDYTRLYRKLMKNYERSIAPSANPPVVVNVYVELTQLLDVIESKDQIVTNLWIRQMWTDERLSWNSTEYADIAFIRLPHATFWLPDIALYNSIETVTKRDSTHVNGVVMSDGRVIINMPTIARTQCPIDMKLFPYDTQECNITIGSWSYSDQGLNVSLVQASLISEVDHRPNAEWDIVNSSARLDFQRYVCCPEAFPTITVNLRVQRRPSLFVYVFVTPAVVMALLTPTLFLIPPSNGERSTMGALLMLSQVFQLRMLDAHLPPQQQHVPVVGLYYTCSLVFAGLAVALSAFIINVQHRGLRQNGVPLILRKIFLGPIKRLVFMDTDNFRPYSNMISGGAGSSTPGGAAESPRQGPVGYVPSPMERKLTELVKLLKNANSINEGQQLLDNIVADWLDLVQVLDRLFFALFFFIVIITTMSLLI